MGGLERQCEFSGRRNKRDPYQLETLSHLMGLAESVAAGNDYEGCYFELTQSLDLGGIAINRGDWNPIGWYRRPRGIERRGIQRHFAGILTDAEIP